MDKSSQLAVVLLHSSVNTTIMLIDVMVTKKVVTPGEGAAMLLQYADRMNEDAEKVGIDAQIKPLIDHVLAKIEQLQSLNKSG
ncbi:hypothetical protein FHW02_002036 [Ochrobactrum sp. RH1CCR137]|nr:MULTISPECIES: hypothetical protein [unclassified Ochrobactrum]MBA8843984.1 hypothetical protein [Ochrobactrum sp. RH1CCR137]MBA8856478.1 hypothetical protein [Ochrobactrum sp. RH1CCR134]